MKTIIRISAMACGLFLAGATFAQDKAAPQQQTPGTVRAPQDPTWQRMDLGKLNNVTKPTPEQMGKLKDIESKYEKMRRELPTSLTAEQRANEVKTLMVKRDAETMAVLTPEQKKQWDEAARAPKPTSAKPAPAMSGSPAKPVEKK